ncbi:MAG: 50S ribosomal protein L24 [Candidatus Falkowbacteria bacterium GW2011_GWC2_38_22]|uniref:Large ribosomal subunit protein uL24 n=1 Tax=Candidatus Falkowbacteria bacterium GW2011_GWE1_38_31 TaxID=1618638 RepID=A0A0G0M8P0_9BACT|nr:MAG: 50S ribosomal protein L24 [Candidatus Falkowbacteria bacterium GW2011_GWF2_38_1205]KKQ61181.1 MAG: 50S ribosomal protein L24 [Candidatus Falkowbacteria bacterium GW2011_GWC2_38_22]KKQ63312.1 MAG: 50S ribosomal protein L24 [Candidatus Falkowbacteria bacterium GW2011_GWF1_38_22]KKQ65570.1 MAG: 50S ribosomal protein L24 [Candidatus Falkowbacteria bacterium GW2011_GWE2_38_254]KKQ70044.1 MAG: 50S ribosomal protein L24 [Candidatus Falkowbacteria bacterium GW2011_GWE1_38_31]KKQ72715.1 MAG: 50
MNIKKGDKVKIIAGKDKGKSGKVLQVFPEKNRVSVEGLNLLVKHMRPRRQGEKGQRIEFPAPLEASNLMIECPKCGKPSRIGAQIVKAEGKKDKKFRECKKCKQIID